MGLNLDGDDAPSFSELVRDFRRTIMKNRTMTECWRDLADQHTFFKDIAKEGRTRGETVGAVLSAMQGISQAVQLFELSNSEAGTPSRAPTDPSFPSGKKSVGGACSGSRSEEAQTLVHVARAYLSLYSSTPIPTRAQWLSSLRPLFTQCLIDVHTPVIGASPSRCAEEEGTILSTPPAASVLSHYLTKLRQRVDYVAQELSSREGDDDDDGSFAEEELKELVQCCLVVGRRVARPTTLPSFDTRLVREMVKTLQNFMGSSTLEW
ncbi:hypothetical protein JKF63_01340 [Porcisia hertigi]|uniref:Uncharacterized protein n=1 Tax=Porcisia hertigi TaxID=2761500 RepID=A0A836ICS6_9TRYP|nr:hypothetical protein JKF63_01340 [Porcisia hertigi]